MSSGARASLRTLCLAAAWLVFLIPAVAGAQMTKAHRLGVLAQDLQPGLLETGRVRTRERLVGDVRERRPAP